MSHCQYDLNVRLRGSTRDGQRAQLVKRALELGWDTICWTIAVNGKLSGAAGIKPAVAVQLDAAQRREALQQRALIDLGMSLETPMPTPSLRQLSRLHVTLDDVVDAQSLTIGNEVVRQFDVVSATPGNAKVFSLLCKTADVDVISLDFTHKLGFPLHKKLIDEAVARGVSFELCYSSLLGSSAARQETMSSSRTLVQYLRGRNLVLSSGADGIGLLRGPADVVNMASILGLGAENAARTVARNAALVVRHACSRKLRYLPNEIVTAADFRRRWPEIELKEPAPAAVVTHAAGKRSKKRARLEQEEKEDEEETEEEVVVEEEREEEEIGAEGRDATKEEGGEKEKGLQSNDGFVAF